MQADAAAPAGRFVVRPTTPEDAVAVATLMREAGLRPNVEPGALYWRYWQERKDWRGSRSYVLTNGRKMIAHAALIPLSCETDGHRLKAAHLIDWAARSDEPGAGAMLLKHLIPFADVLIDIGGSDASLELLPILGFRRLGSARGFVRCLRPLRLLSTGARPGLRLLARVARSNAWRMTAPRASPRRHWKIRQVPVSGIGELAPLLARRSGSLTAFERSESLLEYMLSCPIAPMTCFLLEEGGSPRGYFILASLAFQARLVDLWVDSDLPADWRGLIQCAVYQASRNRSIAEIATWGSDPMLSQCLQKCGFRERFALPIWARSTGTVQFSPTTLRVQMMDSDAAYLSEAGGGLWA